MAPVLQRDRSTSPEHQFRLASGLDDYGTFSNIDLRTDG